MAYNLSAIFMLFMEVTFMLYMKISLNKYKFLFQDLSTQTKERKQITTDYRLQKFVRTIFVFSHIAMPKLNALP